MSEFKPTQQIEPLPGCNFVIHDSPPHYSETHKIHNDPPIGVCHQIKSINPDGLKIVDQFHTPVFGQTTLTDIKW